MNPDPLGEANPQQTTAIQEQLSQLFSQVEKALSTQGQLGSLELSPVLNELKGLMDELVSLNQSAPLKMTNGTSRMSRAAFMPLPEIDGLNLPHNKNSIPVLRLNPDGTLLYANQAAHRTLLPDWELKLGQVLPSPWDAFAQEGALGGKRLQAEIPFAGRVYTMDLIPVPEAGYVNLHIQDITERKQAEAVLARYWFLFEHARDILLYVQLSDGRILEANQASEMAYGYTREELLALTILDLHVPQEREQVGLQMQQAQTGGILFETEQLRKDGASFPVEVSALGAEYDQEQVNLCVIRDISERRVAEAALRESEELSRKLIEASPDAIFIHADGKFAFVNPAGVRLLGADRPEQILGRSVLDFMHADYRETVTERIGTLTHDQVDAPMIEEKYVRLDGSTVDVEVGATPYHLAGKSGVLVHAHDVTERKQAEQERERLTAENRRLKEQFDPLHADPER